MRVSGTNNTRNEGIRFSGIFSHLFCSQQVNWPLNISVTGDCMRVGPAYSLQLLMQPVISLGENNAFIKQLP